MWKFGEPGKAPPAERLGLDGGSSRPRQHVPENLADALLAIRGPGELALKELAEAYERRRSGHKIPSSKALINIVLGKFINHLPENYGTRHGTTISSLARFHDLE